jgi:hypothetical protein
MLSMGQWFLHQMTSPAPKTMVGGLGNWFNSNMGILVVLNLSKNAGYGKEDFCA